ncbi:MAG: hypothetical protein VYA71_08825 [Pseudomonadota bacterium]|nr:hypothetical protein [Pseudomonadota bacterium]
MFRTMKHGLVGGDGAMVMPVRVAGQIKREQEDSEILIGWMQFAGVTFFAVVYTIAPKTFDADVMFAPVPWALGFYCLFTVVCLFLAHGRRLPPWMVTLSVIIDMAGPLVTIWSFHLQDEQEPGFSLKAPTLLYIFILITLRALWFDARYVVLAGAPPWLARPAWLCPDEQPYAWRHHPRLRSLHHVIRHFDWRRGRQDFVHGHGYSGACRGSRPGTETVGPRRHQVCGGQRSFAFLRALGGAPDRRLRQGRAARRGRVSRGRHSLTSTCVASPPWPTTWRPTM